MSQFNYVADPVSRAEMRSVSGIIRKEYSLLSTPFFDIVQLYDAGFLGRLRTGWDWAVVNDNDFSPNVLALTVPEHKSVYIRETVFDRACDGIGRDRFTLVHEAGHVLLHANGNLARATPFEEVKPFKDPEWQANCFAGELLVDACQIKDNSTIFDVSKQFGVSFSCAKVQITNFLKDKLLIYKGGKLFRTQLLEQLHANRFVR